jgi:integral membrane protein (TIGR01906 family)
VRASGILASALVALAVPLVVTVDGIRLTANGWYVEAVYEHGGLEPDEGGLTDAQREALALTGLHAVEPGSAGTALLRAARLPDGRPAFADHEVSHMEDVRDVVRILYPLHIGLAAAVVAFALVSTRVRRARPVLLSGLRAGALLALAVAAFAGAVLLIEPDWFSTGFHALFFEGDSWRFADGDTLRRIYPERFWTVTSATIAVAAVVQALAIAGAAHLWLRRRQA